MARGMSLSISLPAEGWMKVVPLREAHRLDVWVSGCQVNQYQDDGWWAQRWMLLMKDK